MSKNKEKGEKKRNVWPEDCVWPEPLEAGQGYFWETDLAKMMALDEDGEDLLEIKDYMDDLVESGRLDVNYSLNEDYGDWDEGGDIVEEEEFLLELGEEYWDAGFDIEAWEENLTVHLNLLKLPLPSPVGEIEQLTGYEFINENLLRQAFTRRAYGLEYDIGDNEDLELIGDTVLNTVVTREIFRHLTEIRTESPDRPFYSPYTEGDLTRIRTHFIRGEYLSIRACELGLDRYILYGTGEESSESSLENVIEALIGAVAVDCDWDWNTLEGVVDRLLCIQLSNPSRFLSHSYYDTFNAWHQKHFGRMPQYEVSKGKPIDAKGKEFLYTCSLRFQLPENDKGIEEYQRINVERESRSKARELAAELAYRFVVNKGLWMRLEEAHIIPNLENSINQLQELYQKKYVEQPEYTFEQERREWLCDCICGSFDGWGRAEGKVKAKKKAAYMVLKKMMKAAGISKEGDLL